MFPNRSINTKEGMSAMRYLSFKLIRKGVLL